MIYKPVNFPKLSEAVSTGMDGLQSLKALDVGKTSETIFLNFKNTDHQSVVELVRFDLFDPVLGQIKFSELLEFVEEVSLLDFIVTSVQDL
jgi:hypothetical protein